MRVFVATKETQGDRPDDYCFTVDGEMIRFAFDVCDCSSCGCDRGVAGLSSSRATTTFKVKEAADLTLEKYTGALRDALTREGWIEHGVEPAWVAELAERQASLAAELQPGTVLGIDDTGQIVRR